MGYRLLAYDAALGCGVALHVSVQFEPRGLTTKIHHDTDSSP